ncbi:MAG: tetratricopeptide repeat protein [Pseudomonadota bacterium]
MAAASTVLLAFSSNAALSQHSLADAWSGDATAAFAEGTSAYYSGDVDKALRALEFAAEGGHAIARWKLARMYADGDGVGEDHLRAFRYFSEIATAHAEDRPDTPQARFVANAFVALGGYYSRGIGDVLAADPSRSRQIYTYAASYFGDADAQYRLGRMMLSGEGGGIEPRQAGRWLSLAARKGHMDAQIALGELLFSGDEQIAPHHADGLKWLIIAGEFAELPSELERIRPIQERYLGLADPDLRARAVQMAEEWLTGPEGALVLQAHRSNLAQR